MSAPPPAPPPVPAGSKPRGRWIKNLCAEFVAERFAPNSAGPWRAWTDLVCPRVVQPGLTVTPLTAVSTLPADMAEAMAQARAWADTGLTGLLMANQLACATLFAQHKQPKQVALANAQWANESLHRFHQIVSGTIYNVVLPLFWAAKGAELKAMGATPEEVAAALVFVKTANEYVQDGDKATQNGPAFNTDTMGMVIHARTNRRVGPTKGTRTSTSRGPFDGCFVAIELHVLEGITNFKLAAPVWDAAADKVSLVENFDPFQPDPANQHSAATVADDELQTMPVMMCCPYGKRKENDPGYKHDTKAALKAVPAELEALHAVSTTTDGSIVTAKTAVEISLHFGNGCGKPAAKRYTTAAIVMASLSTGGLTLRSLLDTLSFVTGFSAMGPTKSLTPQNTAQMIHFVWNHCLRHILKDRLVVPAPDAHADRARQYEALVAKLPGEVFVSRPRYRPPQSDHHHAVAVLSAMAEAGLPLVVNYERFSPVVLTSVAVYDVADAVEDLAAAHDPDGTALAGHSFDERLGYIKTLSGWSPIYEVLLSQHYRKLVAMHLWRQYQRQVRQRLCALAAPKSILQLAAETTPIPWADPVWQEFADVAPTHPLVWMVVWAANELGMLHGEKSVTFGPGATAQRALTLPYTTYVALAATPADVEQLVAVGFVDTNVDVKVDCDQSLWLPQGSLLEQVPWPATAPAPELVTSAVAKLERGVLFAHAVSPVRAVGALWDVSPRLVAGTVGRLPFVHPVSTTCADSPSRVELPAWIYYGMCWQHREQRVDVCNTMHIWPVPLVEQNAMGTPYAAVLLVYLVLTEGNIKKARAFYRAPCPVDVLATDDPRQTAIDLFFDHETADVPVVDDCRPTSPKPRLPQPAEPGAAPLAARLASMETVGHHVDIETGILAVSGAEGGVKVLTTLVDLVADDCTARFGVVLTQESATDGWYRLREIWHVGFKLQSYNMRIVTKYSTLDKASIQKLHEANYRLELDVTTGRQEVLLYRARVAAIAQEQQAKALMDNMKLLQNRKRNLYDSIGAAGESPASKRHAYAQLVEADARLFDQVQQVLTNATTYAREMTASADSVDTTGASAAAAPAAEASGFQPQ